MDKKENSNERFRWITQTLILSICLNIIFIGIFFYFFVRENPLTLSIDYFPKEETPKKVVGSTQELIKHYLSCPYNELLTQLDQLELVEYGFRKRDFALAVLVKRDYLDIQRALGRKYLPVRKMLLEPDDEFPLFMQISEGDIEKIKHFIQLEPWPLSAEGLFMQLKHGKREHSLLMAFFQTPEFLMLESIFARGENKLKKRDLLDLVMEGSFETLSSFSKGLKKEGDFSDEARRCFILHYITAGSSKAAHIFLISDFSYIVKSLSNESLISLLEVLPPSEESALLIQKILESPREDSLKLKAKKWLTLLEERSEDVARVIPRVGTGQLRPVFRETPLPSPSPQMHVVQPGESLWIIAKKYQVKVDDLMRVNQLQTSQLQVGKVLKIPIP